MVLDQTKPSIQYPTNKLIIGVTGGIGSGKSVVTHWFEQQHDITIVDADVIAHQITQKNSPTLQKLVECFGDWILDNTGSMDRQAMRQYVFDNPEALRQLQSITHPDIRTQIQQQLEAAQSVYVILSAPLLLEGGEDGLKKICHRVLVVDVPETLQIQRASARDGQSSKQIQAIMAKQLSRKERLQQADDVVVNDGTLEELYNKLAVLHEKYMTMVSSS